MHEHITRALYYFEIHLLYASMVGLAAWALTSIRGGSATTKYWIWVATSLNFVLPVGAVADKLWASHLSWAAPLGSCHTSECKVAFRTTTSCTSR